MATIRCWSGSGVTQFAQSTAYSSGNRIVPLHRYPVDLVYVRKDLMDERIAALTAVIKRLGGET